MGEGRRGSSEREIYALLLGRMREGREFLLNLQLLNCLQLKTILMPKWHILGWHVLHLVNYVGGSIHSGRDIEGRKIVCSVSYIEFENL